MAMRIWLVVLVSSLVVAQGMVFPVGGASEGSTPADDCRLATPAASLPVAVTPAAVAATRVRLQHGDALLWGAGEHGVVLVHGAAYDAASWSPQAEAMVARGMAVLAVEELSVDAVLDGVRLLRDHCGVRSVALIGASAGTTPVLEAAEHEPAAIDQIIILSGSGDVSRLDNDPKLFVASEDEGMADSARQMADEAPGKSNEALIVDGNAHAQAIFRAEPGDDVLDALIDWLEQTWAEV